VEQQEQDAFRRTARAVRELRGRHGWSIDQLASRAGVSKGALVAVEHATTNPSLATLVRVADALGVPVSQLLADDPPGPVRVIDPGALIPLWRGDRGGLAVLLLTVSGNAPVEIWRWKLGAGERYTSHPHRTGATETITVLRGTLDLVVGGEHHHIATGNTVTFAADCAHEYGGAGDGCELLMTVHLPDLSPR
jgi:transcriptional regulator with XRE-family HTH domain